MAVVDVNSQYEGKWVLMAQDDSSKYFIDGFVVAVGEDTDEDFTALADTLESELTSKGFVHYAHVDEGESFHVVFGNVT